MRHSSCQSMKRHVALEPQRQPDVVGDRGVRVSLIGRSSSSDDALDRLAGVEASEHVDDVRLLGGDLGKPSVRHRDVEVSTLGMPEDAADLRPERRPLGSSGCGSPSTVHGPWKSAATAISDGFGKYPVVPDVIR